MMIQSMDCRFYKEESEADGYGSVQRPNRRFACSKVGSAKRRNKRESPGNTLKEKKKQGSLTTKWLKQNYCACPDVCLPREIVYEQYLEFCRKERIPPACKATFGKLIRNAFPEVSSKRLGARGHSKYHYNGIGIKQSSEFRNVSTSFEGVTRFSSVACGSERGNPKKFSLSSKVGTLLPNFPDVEDLVISSSSDKVKMATFILMYRTHCQCIVDVVISGNFEEIRLFLLHFWQGFPEHLMPLTSLDIFLDLVAVCDCILYRTLLDVLIPSTAYEMPERLLRSIQNTGMHWGLWIQCSLENMPQKLMDIKMATAKRFCRSLKRYVAFMHLSQVTRPILASDAPVLLYKELKEMQPDIADYWSLNTEQGGRRYISEDIPTARSETLQSVLKKSGSIDVLIECLDKMILDIKGWKDDDKAQTRNFIFNWVYMLSKVSYILTEKQSRYFTTFHILSSLIQEYILLAAESQMDKEEEENIYSRFKRQLKSTDSTTSEAKPPTSCFLVKNKKIPDVVQPTKHIPFKNTERNESRTQNFTDTRLHSIECSYYPRTETDASRNNQIIDAHEMPSCKYASNRGYISATYHSHLHPVTEGGPTEGRSANESYYYPPGNYASAVYTTRADRMFNVPEELNMSQLELCQLDRNPCSRISHRVYSNYESIQENNGNYQGLVDHSVPLPLSYNVEY